MTLSTQPNCCFEETFGLFPVFFFSSLYSSNYLHPLRIVRKYPDDALEGREK